MFEFLKCVPVPSPFLVPFLLRVFSQVRDFESTYPYSNQLAFAGKYSAVAGATSSSTCSTCTAGTFFGQNGLVVFHKHVPLFLLFHLLMRVLSSCVYLTASLRIDLRILLTTRFCRDIFCRDGGHVKFGLLRLYCRYCCVNMALIGGGGLGVLHMSCHVWSFSSLFYFKERATLALDDVPQDNRNLQPLSVSLSRGLLSSGLIGSNFMPCRCRLVGWPSSTSFFSLESNFCFLSS
jgi:hypothetical protein